MQQRRGQQILLANVTTETASTPLIDIPAEGILTLVPAETSQSTTTATTRNETDAPRVTFHESIVDNEHLGRKKSKICCIYRRPYDPNASSSDETTSEEEGSDEGKQPGKKTKNEAAIGNSYEVQPNKKKHKHHNCSH